MHPKEYRIITKDQLLHKYLDGDWPKTLQEKYRLELHKSSRKITSIWLDGDEIIAIVNQYLGGATVVRQLRDGDVMYYAQDRYGRTPVTKISTTIAQTNTSAEPNENLSSTEPNRKPKRPLMP